MHVFLLIEIVDDRLVLASQRLKPLFPSGIWQAAPVKHESTAVSGFIFRQALVKGKTENANGEIVSFAGQTLQLF